MQIEKKSPVCWLFCTVIDNLGDIGVSWRLAQILSRESGISVHLWLDDIHALRTLCPNLPDALPCNYQGISLYPWQPGKNAEHLDKAPPPDLVIETFACDLPENVLNAIRTRQALWLNWEYLSAESWAEAMHGKPSPQTDGQQKYFWLMGFTERSGGLLREKNYAELVQYQAEDFRKSLCLSEKTAPEWLLFGYESPVWSQWLHTWQQSKYPITLLLAGKQVIQSLQRSGALPAEALQRNGDIFQTGTVKLVRIPFIPQSDFDKLLHLCDGAIVRGEDSFIRAQFAAKPFFWFIYPQEENAHIEKLHAFWHKAAADWPEPLKQAHQSLSDELNGANVLSAEVRQAAWQTLISNLPTWQKQAEKWRDYLFTQHSATEKLNIFINLHNT
ncbi:elongation factor P maturation arginine rhamnosyltransferase EarP [Neisseria sp. 83E34]|uniref:elongation factor P maturation arginine rhamnosyltransferase EarP n=1 Tax=Neisseria sp. 83E34 TaxID=1692264 RepID=UPI0006CE731F|nr:elongation factor P maturation arginine rhamnosyltransferase EarP [Neisseria sp. 83E34]KPN71307.1 hypothetical protein AKG09_07545 [Neisseria sp. 83E34]